MLMIFLLYILLGCFSSFLSGLLGVGGSLVIIPGLLFIFSTYHLISPAQFVHIALGTSLACAAVNLLCSLRLHYKNNSIRQSVFIALSPGLILGALLLGPVLMQMISGEHLKIGFGCFCLFTAIQMTFQKKSSHLPEKLPSKFILFILGIITGSISTLLGIAGGAITGLILNHFRMNIRHIIGTSAAVGAVIALSGSAGIMLSTHHEANLPDWSTGFIYWPAFLGLVLPSFIFSPLGAITSHKLPVNLLKKLFAGLVFVIGLKMVL